MLVGQAGKGRKRQESGCTKCEDAGVTKLEGALRAREEGAPQRLEQLKFREEKWTETNAGSRENHENGSYYLSVWQKRQI